MPASEQIAIAPHLAFDAITAGMPGAPLVLLLHGFAESMHCWRAQVACLGDMGYRAIAPSQRGYSPGARPDPREFSHYLIDRLMDDAMAIVAAAVSVTKSVVLAFRTRMRMTLLLAWLGAVQLNLRPDGRQGAATAIRRRDAAPDRRQNARRWAALRTCSRP